MVQLLKLVKPLALAFFAACLLAPPSWAAEAQGNSKLDDDLIYQAFFGQRDNIIELVEQGANANAKNKDGVPAISLAATRNDPHQKGVDVIKALLAEGADINQVDTLGQTALFYAARTGNQKAAMLLLESGADFYAKDKNGKMARDIAYDRGYIELFNAMDGFINQKRDDVMNEYKEQGERLVKQSERLAQMAANPPKAPEPEPTPVAPPKPQPVPKPKPIDEEQFYDTVKKLSYNACAMEYWNFVKRAQLKTPLTSMDLNKTIAEHRNNAKTYGDLLQKLGADKKYVATIIKPSQEHIFDEMDEMGSNITRKSHGVGELDDVDKRCNQIADSWNLELPY